MSDKPDLRRYQFSLRTMFAMMLAIGLGFGGYAAWRQHQRFCITQCHRLMDDVAEDGGYVLSLLESDEPCSPDELRELEAVNAQRDKVAVQYMSAVYRPWERIWIDSEPRPPKRPERFEERRRSARNSSLPDR